MTVNKITNPPSQKGLIDKVNEIIDNFTLDELANVSISSPSAGQNLTYDATNQVWKNTSTSATVAWGGITGTLSDQTDLASALNDKYDASNPENYTSVIESTVSGWGFTKNVGTVTSVNNVSPVNGNVSLAIPTVNNATLTIQKNGTTVKTFTANASTDVTANITVPTKTSDLTNDSGFITGITSGDVTTALGFTPYNSTNPSGYQANVIETVKVNGTALTVTSKAVDVTVPTKVSQLTNDSGYTTNVGTVTKVNNTSPDSSGNVTISIPAAQVNSDWNATSGIAQILNKPTLATVATSGSYNDLSDRPTIPTVNNATLTIQKNGTNVSTFTANASSNVTANITVPTKISDLTDDTATYPIDKADTLTGLTATVTELNYVDGVTSSIQTQLDGKQASGNYVTTDTAQTISAVKTFSAEPLINNNIQFGNVSTGSRGIWGKVGDNDYWRVYGGATAANAGYMELATADDGNEPIYIRQYTGQFSTLKRTATILDASGNTTFPGSVTATSFEGNASSATKLGTSTVGGTTTPIYLNGGTPTALSYTIAKSVPSDAVFTDTKNTAGSTDSSSKLFLIGATSQAANPQTYSHDTAFVDTDGALNSVTPTAGNSSTKVATTAFVGTALNDYQAKLVSGTNIKTVNNTSLLGSGDISITGLPSQTSQNGKFLTTNGTTASWANIPTEIPTQTGNSGKFLTTNGTTPSWGTIPTEVFWATYGTTTFSDIMDAINAGKLVLCSETFASVQIIYVYRSHTSSTITFITCSGGSTDLVTVDSSNNWDSVSNYFVTSVNNISPTNGNVSLAIPTVNNATLTITQGGVSKGTFTANASSNVTIALDSGVTIDNTTITENASDELQTVAVKDNRSGNAIKTWTGTKAQYDAITTKDANTLYNITDDTSNSSIVADLNNKCDVDGTNATFAHIVESYVNGTSWYRVYSDGWCEQGGYIPAGSTSSTISLLKNYVNTNYQVKTSPCSTGDNFTSNITSYPQSGSQFIWNSYNNSATSKIWQACGYIN